MGLAPWAKGYIGPMIRALLWSIADRVPSQCAACGGWPAEPVCEACVDQFAQPLQRCRTCAVPVAPGIVQCGACMRSPPPVDACLAAVTYAYPWSGLIVQFKFRGRAGWSRAFAGLLRSTPWVEPALEQANLVLPMPLSAQRLRSRGFNQALELARQLAPDKTDATLLLRILDTPPQSTLPRAERLRNVRHAFAIEPLRAGVLAGARVVLVDDVMTSGASIHAVAATLRQAGAAHVTAIVLARAELAGDSAI